jgi:hypothetical protein
LPTVTPGAPCPTSKTQLAAALSPDLSPQGLSPGSPDAASAFAGRQDTAIGSGPVYLILDSANTAGDVAVYKATPAASGYHEIDYIQVSAPSYRGPLVTRAHQVDGTHDIQWGPSIDPAFTRVWGTATDDVALPHGWVTFPSFFFVPVPGCYAFQIDGTSFSEVIVFPAIAPP